ncbi:MAG: hypothetical protein GY950_06380 [bacterium]|nr:hypothetical protein [bacterium]
MKKVIILILMILLMFGVSSLAFGDSKKEDTKPPPTKKVTKTYVLKHISPRKVHKTLRAYFWNSSYDSGGGNMFTVEMPQKNVASFEEMLKKLDVEKKKAMLRVFTVIASNEGKSDTIENKDLKQVLSELKKVLSFKAFRMDGVSALTVKDGQEYSTLMLSSKSSLRMELRAINFRKEQSSRQTVGFTFELSQQAKHSRKDGKPIYSTLVASETSVKENGYLVAGVSKIGENGDSLILVINAEIK